MNTETDIDTYGHRATYSPEDNKLRLYVGRVPRDEFLKLRAEGWTTLHKQREAGGGDFAAVWTPQRRDTALAYAGIIEDEDMGPEERAADRAERFGVYRDKRADEAGTHAERFEAGPTAHGFQSQARAEKAAARHDRIADRAGDAWSKAEYWQRRTAGVISHALHVSSPSVRMGRIKELEADLRRMEQSPEGYPNWLPHTRLRLAYENQMLEAQGGRAGVVEMQPGGWLRGGRRMGNEERQIVKVNKSPVSGRVVSVLVRDNYASSHNHYGNPFPDGVAKVLSHTVEVERMSPDCYRAPTPEELAEFEAKEKEAKKARKAIAPPALALINPTDADAERLVTFWNERRRAAFDRQHGANAKYFEFKPCEVERITQAIYSANSKGAFKRAETRDLCADGQLSDPCSNLWSRAREERRKRIGDPVCKIRVAGFESVRVLILTDKPQKPLPAAVWQALQTPEAVTA